MSLRKKPKFPSSKCICFFIPGETYSIKSSCPKHKAVFTGKYQGYYIKNKKVMHRFINENQILDVSDMFFIKKLMEIVVW